QTALPPARRKGTFIMTSGMTARMLAGRPVATKGWEHQTMADTLLKAGYDEADITPPLGGSMPGYFQDRRATGVLDPLKAKVLYLARGNESVALVACDLIGMGAPLVARIRERVRQVSKAPPRHVWVHSG